MDFINCDPSPAIDYYMRSCDDKNKVPNENDKEPSLREFMIILIFILLFFGGFSFLIYSILK